MPAVSRRLLVLAMSAALAVGAIGAPVEVSAAIGDPGASIVVTGAGDGVGDDGVCTLREAITAANDNTASPDQPGTGCTAGTDGVDVITFDAAVTTVTPASTLPDVTTAMTINGGTTVSIDGDTTVQLLHVTSTGTLTLLDITLKNGAATNGGALLNEGTTTLDGATLTGNAATGSGGAVWSSHALTVTDTTFSSNTSGGDGGAITASDTLDITGSVFSSNTGATGGGALSVSGTITVGTSAFTGNVSNDWGGAILLGVGSLTATASVFDGNTAVNNGGAIASDPASATISVTGGEIKNGGATYGGGIFAGANVTATLSGASFSGNAATQQGGALYAAGTVTATNGTFSGNSAAAGGAVAVEGGATFTDTGSSYDTNSTSSNGGAGIVTSGATTLTGTSFTGNAATGGAGGAISVVGGTAHITSSTIDSNSADLGAGIDATAGTLTVTRTTISNNQAAISGGGIELRTGAAATVTRSLLASNSAATGGGASIATPSTFTLANSTVYANHSDNQAGGIQAGGTTTLVNVTVTGNDALGQGGGISAEGTVTVNNSILVGNTATSQAELAGSVTGDSGDNLLGGTATDIFAIGSPEVLGQGPAVIRLKNSATNPAVDTADSATCAAAPVGGVDQRGYARPALCDMGAHELDKVGPTISTPQIRIRTGATLDGSKLRVRVSWTGSDNAGGSGLAGYVVAMSTNGGDFLKLDLDPVKTAYRDVSLAKGSTYRFQVRAVDNDLNVKDAFSTTVVPSLVQQSSSSFTYKGTWKTSTNTVFSGGSAKYATASGASFSITRTARGYAFITTKGPKRGKARIYVNGTLVATVDLYAKTNQYRVQAWTKWYTTAKARTLRVVVVGTSGRPRVDADAIAVLK